MGGSNQATCPTPPAQAKSRASASSQASSKASLSQPSSFSKSSQPDPIRYHEDTARGQVDFHNDIAGFKCAVDSAAFFAAYTPWRSQMSNDLVMLGEYWEDGSDEPNGHAFVTFSPHVDKGEMQVTISVSETEIGGTVLDLDKLAHFS